MVQFQFQYFYIPERKWCNASAPFLADKEGVERVLADYKKSSVAYKGNLRRVLRIEMEVTTLEFEETVTIKETK